MSQEKMEESNNGKKRVRPDSDESDPDQQTSKRVLLDRDSGDSVDNSAESRVDPGSDSVLLRDDILEILEDTDGTTEIADLDSVIKSFEEEILHPAGKSGDEESPPDLGYLLEASDDELGLPPAVSPQETEEQEKNEVLIYDSFGFENELPSYEAFGYGFGVESEVDGGNQFVNVGGLFEYSEEPADFSEFLWRPETETLPAV